MIVIGLRDRFDFSKTGRYSLLGGYVLAVGTVCYIIFGAEIIRADLNTPDTKITIAQYLSGKLDNLIDGMSIGDLSFNFDLNLDSSKNKLGELETTTEKINTGEVTKNQYYEEERDIYKPNIDFSKGVLSDEEYQHLLYVIEHHLNKDAKTKINVLPYSGDVAYVFNDGVMSITCEVESNDEVNVKTFKLSYDKNILVIN